MSDIKALTREIQSLKSLNKSLQAKVDFFNQQLESTKDNNNTFDSLSLTETILENSSTVLFRRLAAVDPKKRKMVYVSPNISCFGYKADDFIKGKIMFRDIVYPEDSDRTLKEIREFVRHGIENYSQTYRIVTHNGEVRWIEDRTSIYEDKSTGLRYHQGIVIDIHEKKKALQLAAEVQKSLLPDRAPSADGLDIAGKMFPCDEVGGDYFDYLPETINNNNYLSIVIGDITGHGVDAALLMTSARAFLRMRAAKPGTVEDVVMDLNRHLTRDMEKTGRFMTLFYLFVERSNNRMAWVRAGHDPVLQYDPAIDRFNDLKGPGIALGLDKDFIYQKQHVENFATNQVFVLATDGLYEACNTAGEMFGKERLKNIVQLNSTETSEIILDRIMQEHHLFTSGVAREDDITLVIVKII